MLGAGELDALWGALPVPRARFVIWPSVEQLDWHRERERAYAELFGRAPLPHAGARSDGGVIAWAADFKNEKLDPAPCCFQPPAAGSTPIPRN